VVWGSLVVVTIAELGVGFLYPVTDQWAHAGGLIAGVVVGAALSRNVRWRRAGGWLALVIGIAFAAAAAVAAVAVARTSIADSLAAAPRASRDLGGIRVTAPSAWLIEGHEVYDPDLFLLLSVERRPGELAAQLADYTREAPGRAKERRFETAQDAIERIVPLPDGWSGSELAISVPDALGSRQDYRVIVAGHAVPGGVVLASFYAPLTVAREAPDFFTHVLESVQ
jgi:hypothetical protein